MNQISGRPSGLRLQHADHLRIDVAGKADAENCS